MVRRRSDQSSPYPTHGTANTRMDKVSKSEDGGWTHVKRKPGRRAANPQPTEAQDKPSPINPNPCSAAQLETEYRRVRQRWGQSSCHSTLQTIIKQRVRPQTKLSRAVCLGIGTFDPVDGGWEARRRTYVQLIAFLSIVEVFESITGTKITCYFQDPVFNTSDKTLIQRLGHIVVETPEAFDLVDDLTFLYGVHLYWDVYAQSLAKSTPTVFVGTDIDVWDGLDMLAIRRLENMDTMEKTYNKDPFPQDDTSTAFSTTSIYWHPCHDLEP